MKVLGQDVSVVYNQLMALVGNLIQWLIRSVIQPKVPRMTSSPASGYISIAGPGGYERLSLVPLEDNQATLGYNLPNFQKGCGCLINIADKASLPSDSVIVRIHYFSINYADIAIRWGLYESALRYVGWPIIPGFDLSGVVEWAGSDSPFSIGDQVFGFSMFGTYSSRILVPHQQIRKLPKTVNLAQGAALPAVAATGLHALEVGVGHKNHILLIKQY